MKEREFIEDLEALSRQYWGNRFELIPTARGINICYPVDDQADLQRMVKQITGQP